MKVLHYHFGKTSLGKVLIAKSQKGLCAVLLGGSVKDLQEYFPHAECEEDRGMVLEEVIDSIENPKRSHKLALDLHGTPFQKSVWEALRQIPLGKTASYSAIAEKLGKPKAVRAVANACGANPIAVFVPCHRVIGKNGKLTGYRWGLSLKQDLLTREGVI